MSDLLGGWKISPLGELADISIGGTPSRDIEIYWASNRSDGFPWVAISDLQKRFITSTKEQITRAGIRNSNVKPVGIGTVLMSFKLSLGRVAFAGCDLFTNEAIAAFKTHGEICDEFLFYILPEVVRTAATDVAIKGATLNKESLKALEIPVPAIPIQKKIAAILNSIDTAIEKTEALIAKYQQIKAGLMHDLFTRGVLPNGQLRPPRDLAPELYQETAIGWIPMEWVLKEISTIADVIDPQPDHRTPPEALEGIPYVGIGDFNDYQELALSSCRKIVHRAYQKQMQRFTVNEGDIIYGKIGTIGQPKRLPFGGYAISANVILLKPKIDSLFFYYSISNMIFDNQVSNITNTTSQPALGIEKVRCLFFPSPLESEAKSIGKILHRTDAKINHERRYRDNLKHQKLGLMQDLLTGKVPVKADPSEAGND